MRVGEDQFLTAAAPQSSRQSAEEALAGLQVDCLPVEHLVLHEGSHLTLAFLNLALDAFVSAHHQTFAGVFGFSRLFLLGGRGQTLEIVLVGLDKFVDGSDLVLHDGCGKFIVEVKVAGNLLLEFQSLQASQFFLASLP
jgi:hypothetical protein